MSTTAEQSSLHEQIHGMMACFETPEALMKAARKAREQGYREMDAYAPMPVEGLAEAIGFETPWVSRLVFVAGLAGATGGFTLCYWMAAIAYPHNVGGRPLNSWPAWIPITFESMVLLAAITAVVGMLALNGLPQPYHPVFNVSEFERASRDRFFLCIESDDPLFDPAETRSFLESLNPLEVSVVDR
jgi:Protein of unknown function (DUF3341)